MTDRISLIDLITTSRSRARAVTFQRAPGPYSGARFTFNHDLYNRVPIPTTPEIIHLGIVPGVVDYVLLHDRQRCKPFGVFLVHRVTPQKRLKLIGTSLSRPDASDCARLHRDHLTRTKRHDPTLPEPLLGPDLTLQLTDLDPDLETD